MIEKAIREFGIDWRNSFVTGDKISDIETGHRAGCKPILRSGEDPLNNEEKIALMSDYAAPDLYEAVKRLIKHSGQKDWKRLDKSVARHHLRCLQELLQVSGHLSGNVL